MTAPTQDHWRFNLMGRLTRRCTSKAARYRARVSDSNGWLLPVRPHPHFLGACADSRRRDRAQPREAATDFAKRLIEMRGKVTDAESIYRRAGCGLHRSADRRDYRPVGAVAAQYLLTNFMNNANDTDIDFLPAKSPDGACPVAARGQAQDPFDSKDCHEARNHSR
jgi:hypothetical protein